MDEFKELFCNDCMIILKHFCVNERRGIYRCCSCGETIQLAKDVEFEISSEDWLNPKN